MGKSKETWGKKDVRNKKEKKRKEKEKKRLERKENKKDGTSFDDMIAYVDEHGNITSTPPDPLKKVKINVEDIQISIPKGRAAEPEDKIRRGTVTFFNNSKGYGFITDLLNKRSIFVHKNSTLDEIQENDKVIFEIEMGKRGASAVNVKLDK
jgi:cold shock CspA family protein